MAIFTKNIKNNKYGIRFQGHETFIDEDEAKRLISLGQARFKVNGRAIKTIEELNSRSVLAL